MLLAIGVVGGALPVSAAPHSHRRVAAHRVRHAQRLLRASRDAAALVLPAASHRRSHVAGDQRSECRAHDDRSVDHVFGEHDAHARRRAHADAVDRREAHAVVAHPAAVRVDFGQSLRQRDPQTVRADSGAAVGHERRRAGGAVRRARGARLPSGRGRARALPPGERRVSPSQPPADRRCRDSSFRACRSFSASAR